MEQVNKENAPILGNLLSGKDNAGLSSNKQALGRGE
jgi:hypothetical protein